MSPLTSEDSARSPITRVPYDVLREIFIQCLPRYPLQKRQPRTSIVPMLLCHICSFWRTVALESAALWSHLSYCLTIFVEQGCIHSDLVKKEIDFLRWWRKNHGLISPFLHLTISYTHLPGMTQDMAEDGMSFLAEYLMSAQYLDLDHLYWSRLQDTINAGKELVFPNLHTLVNLRCSAVNILYRSQTSLPLHSITSLRRLYITEHALPPRNNPGLASIHWSRLTHISLFQNTIGLYAWFSLIRAVQNLQWAYINIIFDDLADFGESAEPPEYTLPQLSTLCVLLHDREKYARRFAFSLLFSGLHLPAVHTLSLAWYPLKIWFDDDIVAELYSVLNCTPAVMTLALADGFSLLIKPLSSTSSLPDSIVSGCVDPIWDHAKHLVDLQLEIPYSCLQLKSKAEVEEMMDYFVRKTLCSEGNWLDLWHPACPIEKITIVDHPEPWSDSDWEEEEDSFGNFTMSSIRKHTDKPPKADFLLTSESARHIAAGVADEWGSSI